MEKVSIVKIDNAVYPDKEDLFRPAIHYPEYIFEEISSCENKVYDGVRQALKVMGYDSENYGSSHWNPFKEYIKPGMKVLIKPNLVMDKNLNKRGGVECLYTQPSVVAAVIDYVLLALRENDGSISGKIIVGDAPMQACDFNNLINESGYKSLIFYYKSKGVNISLVDFRGLKSRRVGGIIQPEVSEELEGKIIDLANDSEFGVFSEEQLKQIRITNYNPRELLKHHSNQKHEYYISQYILDADIIINMPKPKTHRKAGFTGALKNFVGANVRKEYLPHHTSGAIEDSGDEYLRKSLIHEYKDRALDLQNLYASERKIHRAKAYKVVAKILGVFVNKKDFDEGSWYGNRTISRTIADINKIIYHADKTGILHEKFMKNILIIGDLIVSGEMEGPVYPSPKKLGLICIAENPICFDRVVASIMGFDEHKIPTIEFCKAVRGKYKLPMDNDISIYSNTNEFNNKDVKDLPNYNFVPTSGWLNHIEKK